MWFGMGYSGKITCDCELQSNNFYKAIFCEETGNNLEWWMDYFLYNSGSLFVELWDCESILCCDQILSVL